MGIQAAETRIVQAAGRTFLESVRFDRHGPVYDMLPMQYAPVRGVELPPVNFQPPLPLPAERSAWARAAGAAVQFWDRAAHDTRISNEFHAICAENRDRVRRAIELARA